METKLATITSAAASQASEAHYRLDAQFMDVLRGMTLAGKQVLLSAFPDYVERAEKGANGR